MSKSREESRESLPWRGSGARVFAACDSGQLEDRELPTSLGDPESSSQRCFPLLCLFLAASRSVVISCCNCTQHQEWSEVCTRGNQRRQVFSGLDSLAAGGADSADAYGPQVFLIGGERWHQQTETCQGSLRNKQITTGSRVDTIKQKARQTKASVLPTQSQEYHSH